MKKTDQAPNLTILLGMWKFFKSPCLYWAVLFKDEEFEAHCIIVVSVSLASNMSQFSWRMFTCLNSSGRRVKQYIRTIFYIRLWYSTILFKNNTWNKSDLPMTLQRMKSFNYKEKNEKGLLLVFFQHVNSLITLHLRWKRMTNICKSQPRNCLHEINCKQILYNTNQIKFKKIYKNEVWNMLPISMISNVWGLILKQS